MTLNIDLAHKLCHCCALVLQEESIYRHYLVKKCYPDYVSVTRLTVDTIEAAVFKFNTYSVVAISNTNAPVDWLINLDMKPVKGVHGGYYKSASRLNKKLLPHLKKNPFYITGHSMGGAISAVCSIQHIFNPMWLGTYTFASPRLSCPSYTSFLNKKMADKLLNVQNKKDIVGYLPPFYEQLGEIVYLDGKQPNVIKRHQLSYFLKSLSRKQEILDYE